MKDIIRKLCSLFKKRRPTFTKRRPTLAVIDDQGCIRRGIVEDFSAEYDVTEFSRIPNDLDELNGFDVLIVDGSGIGNLEYRNGVDFLCYYIPLHPEKRYVHYSGFITQGNGNRLTVLGCKCVTKGARHNELITAVTGQPCVPDSN